MTIQTTRPVVGRRETCASRKERQAAARILEIAASTMGTLVDIHADLGGGHDYPMASVLLAYETLGVVIETVGDLNCREQRAEAAMRLRKGQR